MKNKLKILFVLLAILIITGIALIIIEINHSKTNTITEPKNSNTIIGFSNNEPIKVNQNGENTVVAIGQTTDNIENYIYYSIIVEKTLSEEDQILELINSISKIIGYKININKITISNNEIHIDFSESAAPFETVSSYYGDGNEKYFINTESSLSKTIFDSINKTLLLYLGNNMQVFFSVNDENISINENSRQISINKNIDYNTNKK